MTQPILRLFPDLGYAVRMWPRGLDDWGPHCDFKVLVLLAVDGDQPVYNDDSGCSPCPTTDPEKAWVTVEGYVKWDGCANFKFNPNDQEMLLHTCTKREAENLGAVLGRMYDMAAELMPGIKEYAF